MPWIIVEPPSNTKISEFRQFYKRKSKFIVDENLGPEVAKILKDLRWNVKYVSEVSLSGRSDEKVFRYASKHKRIILTHDGDFLDNSKFPFYCNPGIVILPGGDGNEDALVRSISDMLIVVAPFGEIYKGAKIVFYEDREFRLEYQHAGGFITTSRYKFIKKKIYEWKD